MAAGCAALRELVAVMLSVPSGIFRALVVAKANIAESYAAVKDGELFLVNAYIPEYRQANRFNHEPKRPRRLLLHAREIDKLSGGVLREGLTIVPLRVYFVDREQF